MAKKQPAAIATGTEVVEELHVTANDADVEFTDVTGQDDLPEGVVDPKDEEIEDEKPAPKPAAKAKPAKDAEDLPEDLKGKTPAQLAKMYKDAQSVIGRQGTELGDLRRTADQYIKARLASDARAAAPKQPVVEEKQPDDVDFFTNPQAAIAKAIENHPSLKGLQGAAKEYAAREITRQRTETTKAFNEKHSDAGTIMGDENFRAWVNKSPVRQALLLRAHQHYDLAAGDEVFSTWKELQGARATKEESKPASKPVKQVAGKEEARVPTGGNATPRSTGDKSQKIYRRADIIRLMQNDPARYELMADEITKAYQEQRVR